MLGSNGIGDSTLSLRTRLGARLGTLLGVCGMFVCCLGLTQTGPCPGPVEPGCTADTECDDLDSCTADTCTIDEGETEGTCTFTAACDEDHCTDDGCVECLDDTECDNADVCDGAETCGDDGACAAGTALDCDDADACTTDACDAANGCSNTPVECEVGDVCVDGVCITPCDEDADCDDADFCNGAETCTDGACAAGADPCPDDGVFCNGTESCDAATDACQSSGDPCSGDTPVCDETAGACVAGVACDTDADCDDDGLFCSGTERCGDNGFCESTGNPCDTEAGQTCNEDLNSCVNPVGETISFTLGADGSPDTDGTGGDDTYSAPLLFNAGTGTQIASLQNGDSANGGDGDDTLNATFAEPVGGNVVVAPTLSGIEAVNITDFGVPGGNSTTLSGVNANGVTSVNSVNSTDDAVTITNLNSLVSMGITNSTSDLLVTMIAPATNGNTDSSTLTLNGARAGSTVTITTPVNGVETLNVVSSGAAANVLDALTQATGTTLTTLNVSGAQNLTVTAALNTTLTTVNAGTATGSTDLNLTGNAGNVAFTGGSGNDSVNFAASYSTSDTINGGTGTNTLGLFSAQAVAATTQQANVSNIQAIRIADGLNGAVDVTKFGAAAASAATDVTLDTAAAATALTAGNSTVTLGTGNRTATLNNDDTAHTLNLIISGAGTTDVLTVNLQNADLGGATTFTGAESVSVVSGNGSDGTAADGNANTGTALTLTPTFGTGTLNLSGSVAVTLSGAVTASTINAGTMTAAFTMGAETVAGGGATITGTPFNDTLFGSANSDSMSGGDGNDKLVGRAGGDSFVGGNGSDTIQYQQTTDGGAADADNVGMDLINGFVLAAGGDILAFQDNIFFDNADVLDLDIITGAAAGNVVTGFTDGGAGAAQVVVQTTPLTNFAAVAALFTALDAVATDTKVVVIAEVTSVGTFVFFDANTAAANGEVVLGQLVGVTGASLSTIVAANLAVNDG